MNLLDLLLLAALAVSAVGGYRIGLVIRVASLVGLLAGVAAAVVTIPVALDVVAPTDGAGRLVTVVATLLLTVLVTSTVARAVGSSVRRVVHDSPLRMVDRFGGAAAGIAITLVLVWFAAPLAGMVPGGTARAVRGSTVVAVVRDVGPEAPNPLAALLTLLADVRFPEVFTDLGPAPVTQPPPAAIPVDPSVIADVAASAVKVETSGCGAGLAGSGWTAAPDTVVTNAHVVAGADAVQVRRPDGTRVDATVVVFDDDADLAVLQVAGLGLAPLPQGDAAAGVGAATLGHPRGQDQLRVAPARIDQLLAATGRDIYGDDRVERDIVVLGARLERGDSGSAVVAGDGTVVGTVFAVSPDDPDTAYALAPSEVQEALDSPRSPGVTGRCG